MTVLHCYFIYKLKAVLTANRKIIQKTLPTVVLNWLGKIFLILVLTIIIGYQSKGWFHKIYFL